MTAKKTKARTTRTARPAVAPENALTLSREQIGNVLKILKDVNSVELKLVAPMQTHRATIKKLGVDPLEAELRQVFFFDTPNLDLNKAGLVVRARRIQGGGGDTVVKLRPVDPAAIDVELRRSESFKTEIDAVPGGFVCSGSFKGRCTAQEVLDAVSGQAKIGKLFSREQRAFYRKHAPQGIAIDSLATFGPTFVLKVRQWVKALKTRLTVEMWLFPDGSRNLEISAKCEPRDAFQFATELKAYLRNMGIDLTGDQQTKTKAAMEFFGREMQQKARKRA